MGSFRSRSDGSHYPIRGRSLYGPPRHPQLAKQVRGDSPTGARESITYLNREWGIGTRAKKVLLVRAANEEANRAKVASSNARLSPHEREQAREIHAIYRSWVDEHKGKY